MKHSAMTVALCLALAAGAALAHSGVKNKAVKERMGMMGVIQTNTKVLVEMARGKRTFNPDAATSAATKIALAAERVPALFRPKEDDPKSEAKPEIWDNFEDFVAKAVAMEETAQHTAQGLATLDDLRTMVAELGGTCKSCHAEYRE